ncbi:MAG TPA: slipin family protein [Candidatus Nanoarchaeia archaeon]|nr:slipin family protein [Candidatus Nanoarchaeia archaeon]
MVFGLLTFAVFIIVIIFSSIKIVNEYERGVRFTLGKYSGLMTPGVSLIIPILQTWQRVDMRLKTVDIPSQDCVSKDNISLKVNAVLYYKIQSADKAILQVEQFSYAVSQLAQTTMRNIIGEFQLDGILSQRDKISDKIKEIVDQATEKWGIDIERIEIKDIELPENMKRVIAQEAEAEREKRAVIIKASGEVMAADNMAKAAKVLSSAPGAMHLRTLQTLNEISSDASSKIIFAIPIEILEAMGIKKK